MRITCITCRHSFQVDDAKAPAGSFRVKCPKCGKINIASKDSPQPDPTEAAPAAPEAPAKPKEIHSSAEWERFRPQIEQVVSRQVEEAKKEILASLSLLLGGIGKPQPAFTPSTVNSMENGKKALVCEDDEMFVKIISDVLTRLGYSVDVARSTADSLKKLETGFYQLVTVDIAFQDDKAGGLKIIARLNGQKPALRRQTFVALISSNIKTADPSTAFFHGANLTVSKEDIHNLETYILDGQSYFEKLYQTFNEVLAEKS